MTERATARDEIYGLLQEAVDAYNTAHSKHYKIYWDDVDAMPQDGKTAHFRAYIRHGDGGQGSLGGKGNRQFDRAGVVLVQVMTPFGDGFTLDDALTTVARNAFEGISTPNGVWFRQVSPGTEIGKTGGYFQSNVTANFEYTERR